MHLADAAAPVLDAAATTIRLLLVLSPVPTSIATIANLGAEVGREGAEAVADEEEDSNEHIYKREEEEEQEELQSKEDSTTTATGTAVSMALGERMNNMKTITTS
jgi:hypothetical protein